MVDEKSAILRVLPLGFPWQTADPFLFCAHHDDAYPEGNAGMGPDRSLLAGRKIGMDFEVKDGWRMYHGATVPGFPRHPHRGFETVTIARSGYIDHSDSLGATARFGQGDVQWMTAGRGVVHAEMFPLLKTDAPNPAELFQIWLNLPGKNKMVDPYFTMFWSETIPRPVFRDSEGRETRVSVVVGRLGDAAAPAPPAHSWAAQPGSGVAIWTIAMQPGARWTVGAAETGLTRTLYFFRGSSISIGGRELGENVAVQVRSDVELDLENGDDEGEILLLQGRPIGEPVAHYGPFVMNTPGEIQQAMIDYQRTEFGGWPWSSQGPVHPRDKGRFAIHADGRVEERGDEDT